MDHLWLELGRVAAAVILGVAGFTKARHPRPLAWWPASLPRGAAALLPVTELFLAGALLGVGGTWPLVGAGVLFTAFAAVSARAQLDQSTGADCGCLGAAVPLDAGWLLPGLDTAVVGWLAAGAATGGGSAVWAGDSVTAVIAVLAWGSLAGAVFWIVVYASSVSRAVRATLP